MQVGVLFLRAKKLASDWRAMAPSKSLSSERRPDQSSVDRLAPTDGFRHLERMRKEAP
jgi:hypothetical protein